MARKRTGKIWTVPKDDLVKLTKKSNSLRQIIQGCGYYEHSPTWYRSLKIRLEEEGIDYSHIKLGKNSNKGRKFDAFKQTIPLKDILVENSSYIYTSNLKQRLLKEGFLEYKCKTCGVSEWQGKKLSLQLDHINGVTNDNRIENLRLLCPNCHSQTDTFCGKNKKIKWKCVDCGIKISSNSQRCGKCNAKIMSLDQRKVKRPFFNDLIEELKNSNYCAVGRKYGVSDRAIRKWLKFYEKHEGSN